jgi:hypothetical protein
MDVISERKAIEAQQIIVSSLLEVNIDGQNCGKVCDAIANMPQLASQIQVALEKWRKEELAQREYQPE